MTDNTGTSVLIRCDKKRCWRVILANGKHCTMIDEFEIDHKTALEYARHRFFDNCIGVE